MFVLNPGASGTGRAVRSWLTRDRLAMYSCTVLVLYAIVLGAWAWTTRGFSSPDVPRPGVDFSVFWAAAHVMLHGSPWQAYNHLAFAKVESTLLSSFHSSGFLPWLYPPSFLLIVTPLALLPLLISYLLFIGVSTLLFTIATLRISGLGKVIGSRLASLFVAAFPSVFVPAVVGQNSLMTATLAAFAVHWVDRKPVRAGLCIGLLAIKPQMALVFPFVLIAAGAWRALASAAISALLITALGVLACGTETVHAFLLNADFLRNVLLEHNARFWLASPTTFAALRANGVALVAAHLVQACVAVIAIAAACHVWKNTREARLRASVLVIATLLSNPYVWHYELAWLGIALACMTSLGFDEGWLQGEPEILALSWLLPLYEYFNPYTKLPQIGPIVLLLALLAISRRVRTRVERPLAQEADPLAVTMRVRDC